MQLVARQLTTRQLCMLQGTSGNAARYVTRNQALKKLQLHLGEFRCGG